MKAVVVGVASLLVIVGVLVYEEGRIAKLEKEIAKLKEEPAKSSRTTQKRESGRRLRAMPGRASAKADRSAPRARGTAPEVSEAKQASDGSLTEMFRQMTENPVGAAMLKEQNKGRALSLYGDFIDSLNLNEREKEYFVGLLASGVNVEETTGMKLLAAKSEEERVAILDEMEADQAARREAIRDFLNNDEDFSHYEYREERKEIYQQMPGLRAAMEETGAPMTGEQEEQVVEAIYQASVSSGMHAEWDGRAGLQQIAQPGATQRFKDRWTEMQEVLQPSVGSIIERPEQQEAFREHQNLVGNMISSNLQFVEGMIGGQAQLASEPSSVPAPDSTDIPVPAPEE